MMPGCNDLGAAMTVGDLVARAAGRLQAAGVENPRGDARLLIAEALVCRREMVMAYPERALEAKERQLAEALIARRAAREPVSRILGRREFWSLPFTVTTAVLDPRADSETLVAAVLEHAPGDRAAPRLLDLGTGCGCLLLALLSELTSARGLGTDTSHAALMTAKENAKRLGLARRAAFVQASWCDAIGPGWDIILSNPPYIAAAVISTLDPEVRCHDPQTALDGGADGLAAYRALLPGAVRCLASGGLLALEVGVGQAEAVSALLAGVGLRQIDAKPDLAGVVRCLLARR